MRELLVIAGGIGVLLAACATDIDGVPLENEQALAALKPATLGTGACGVQVPALDDAFLGALPACGGAEGKGRCVPPTSRLGDSADQLTDCDDGAGAKCAPESLLLASSKPLKSCKSVGGAGVCISLLVDEVNRLKLILPRDACASDERCAPCVNPTTGEKTGLCDIGKPSAAPLPASCATGDSGIDPKACASSQGHTYVDVSKLASCGSRSHCIPADVVPDVLKTELATCPGTDALCAPDPFVASGGYFVPKTCASIIGAEGRCMLQTLTEVKESADYLPQDVCASDEKCAPCFDPATGGKLAVCDTTCDPGPTKRASLFPECAGGAGRCVPGAVVNDLAASLVLGTDSCQGGDVCAPVSAVARDTKPKTCTDLLLGPGVCIENVFEGIAGASTVLLNQYDCPGSFKCVPCSLPGVPALHGCPGT